MGGRSGAGKHNLTRYGNRTPSKAVISDKKQPSSPSNQLSSNVGEEELPSFMNGLEDEDFFHGLLIRDDGARMCKHEGDFLLLTNEISPASVTSLYILVRHNQEVKDVTIKTAGTKFCFNDIDGTQFDTVCQLIKYYHKKALPVHSDICLKHGVPRNDWELLHRKIELKQKLGEGAQAAVQRGIFFGHPLKPPLEVAVKIHKGNVDNEKLIEIMHEVRIMLQFDHENVVKLIGIAACRAPMEIVLELVHGGGLNRYLKIKRTEVTTIQRICMCADAAAGLEYIHGLGIIHRDVASRNCLYSQSKQRVLISDFGLSQQEEIVSIDPSKPLPIRWLAPEVMTTFQCNKMTDVWSYGVLCWEIFYHCQDPYSDIRLQTEVMDKVISGVRLDFTPENVPQPVIDIVCRCWDAKALNRPSMAEIAIILSKHCDRTSSKNKKKESSMKTKEVLNTSRSRRQLPENSNRSQVERGRKSRKAITLDPSRIKRAATKRTKRTGDNL